MESSSSFYKSRLLCKMILQLLLLLGFFWFLLLGVSGIRRTTSTSKVMMMAGLNPHGEVTGFRRLLPEVIRGQKHSSNKDHKRLERLKFVSKRRVPNGPDPIHNRKAGNSNQPPGRSQRVGEEAAIKGRRQ